MGMVSIARLLPISFERSRNLGTTLADSLAEVSLRSGNPPSWTEPRAMCVMEFLSAGLGLPASVGGRWANGV